MNDLIKININEDQEPVVNGRELYEALEVNTDYRHWFPRMCDYGFIENQDYITLIEEVDAQKRPRTYEQKNHILKLDMAKEIAMLQRNEKGKEVRKYFIQVEKEFNSPEKIMARALKIAENKINVLQLDNSKLTQQNQLMQPKAKYFDDLVDRNLLTNFRETAKELKIKEKDFINYLLDNKYIFRNKKGKLEPYSNKNNGLFEVKEAKSDTNSWTGIQTFITPKGRETFKLLFVNILKEGVNNG